MAEHRYKHTFFNGIQAELLLSTQLGMFIEWSPAAPHFSDPVEFDKFIAEYRGWRNASVVDFSKRTGLRIALVEADEEERRAMQQSGSPQSGAVH